MTSKPMLKRILFRNEISVCKVYWPFIEPEVLDLVTSTLHAAVGIVSTPYREDGRNEDN